MKLNTFGTLWVVLDKEPERIEELREMFTVVKIPKKAKIWWKEKKK